MKIPLELRKMIAENHNEEILYDWDDELDFYNVDEKTEFNLSIGNRVNTITMNPHHPGNISLFKYGFCSIFAYVVYHYYGYPLVVMYDDTSTSESWVGHSTNKIDDSFFDIEGFVDFASIQDEYNILSVEIVDVSTFNSITRAQEVFHSLPLFEQLVIKQLVTNALSASNVI